MKVFSTKPDGFSEVMQIAGFFLQHEDKFLMLKRHPDKLSGGKWNLPGGKMESLETPLDAAIRETHEEAGLRLDPSESSLIGTLYLERGELQYSFHIFRYRFQHQPQLDVCLLEHTEAKWLTLDEAHALPLIDGGKAVIEFCYE